MKRENILEIIFKSRKTFDECAGKKQIWSADRIENFTNFAVNLSEKHFLPQINGLFGFIRCYTTTIWYLLVIIILLNLLWISRLSLMALLQVGFV
jgi:hypothetical protein